MNVMRLNSNVGNASTHRFKPDFFERVVIAEALLYEHLSLLPLSNILINNEISIPVQESILFMEDENFNLLIKNIKNKKIEYIITSQLDYSDESSSSECKRKISVHRLPWSKKIFYNENSHEWCFCLPGQMYNSKLDIYGKWRDGLHEHLNRVMTGFLHARKNQYHLE
ncbi:hypothetical protein DZA65_00392 [Dickeya dianthicola]|uniref:hypothetical protein n=2 Tax=Dickeya dianthicola TaxID=204039 RepID=UPI000ACA73B9|nr:hypothetical protein [Dickeya dianthicola]AYC17307.1 hypothetical protein DZA65_00392 [Dickeya dianthicola]MBI0436235.1 hypothetical protein [Dickeya dianthicola]MBI0450134.1 hypothetical protein [Dickeya dianthicola]MBI0454791.1 hypothetical protein [Dickeya dianthicola]MBI0458870.1 hypothetical protein [Dickeya dianthicola]